MFSPARLLLAIFVVAFLHTSLAQTGVGLSPPRITLEATPGTEITESVVVDHPSASAPMEVMVNLSDVLLAPDGSIVYLEPDSQPRSLASWITVSPLQFELTVEERRELRYTIEVPEDTTPGTYWGLLFFESRPITESEDENPEQGFGVRTRVRVGHTVYVNVGQIARDGQIAGIRHEPSADEMRIAFQNTGNGVIRLAGEVEIRSTDGQRVHSLELSNEVSFPGSTHDLAVPLPGPLSSGDYVALAVLDYGEDSVVAGESEFTVP